MIQMNEHPEAVFFRVKYAQLDLERRDRRGELRTRDEARRSVAVGGSSHPGPAARVLTGTGNVLIWFGHRLKECGEAGQPAAVRIR